MTGTARELERIRLLLLTAMAQLEQHKSLPDHSGADSARIAHEHLRLALAEIDAKIAQSDASKPDD